MSASSYRARRLARWLLLLCVLAFAGWIFAGIKGWTRFPLVSAQTELELQLRDRGVVAVAGGLPWGVQIGDTPVRSVDGFPALATALAGNNPSVLLQALRAAHVDGLLVRTDRSLGTPGSMLAALSSLRAVRGVTAVWSNDTAALYEPRDPPSIEETDASKLVEAVRLMMQGAAPPPERLFPESLRRAQPTEVAVFIRDGRDPILWRAVRGGTPARAIVDATYASVDRWNTRQQQRYGPLRDAILRLPLTIAIFYDRGTLGARNNTFLERAVDRRTYSIGFEHLGRWEYVLPPSPWGPIPPVVRAITDLARERDVPPPGYQRPELTLYRFRALQLIEDRAGGPVQRFDPG